MEDIKVMIVKRVIDMSGNIIADQLSKPDWEAREENISRYYKDLDPIRETLPETPTIHEVTNPNPNANANSKVDRIIGEICTPDLSPEELSECQSCVESVVKDPNVLRRYMEPSK